MPDFTILASYEKTVDDFEKIYGKEVADSMMWEIFTYGATGKREREFAPSIECSLTIIQAKMDKSQERKERAISKRTNKAKADSAK